MSESQSRMPKRSSKMQRSFAANCFAASKKNERPPPRSHHREHRPGQGQDDGCHGDGAARGGERHARPDASVPERFVMKQMGRGFVKVGGAETDPEDIKLVEEAWREAEQAILGGAWDLVILDEINYAISYGMLDPAKVVDALKRKPEPVHVILTGRNAHATIVELADTVTEMRQVKHAYEKGVMAQRGIEY